tara:strand:+ start:27493 stop:31980 length:4488 start_codon:yes stop_codon:yes gene_type:complete
MGIKFSNLASTTLSSGISNIATTITVADGSLFPTLGSGDFFFATLDSPPDSVEIVKVTARSGNTLTVVRAQDGTAASTHPAGEIIALRVTAGALNTIVDEITVQINAVIDSAPGALNTLNELASALGDDANFSTTVTNSLAAKLPLAGGTMSGALNMGSQNITNAGTIGSGAITSTGRGTFNNLTLTGATDHLTFNESSGDWTINNAQQNNGITIFDGASGVQINYNGSAVVSVDSGGGFNLLSGALRINGTGVIDTSRNLTNIGTISSGSITSSGLHVLTATAGSVTPVGGSDDLIVENNTSGGISILTPDNAVGQIVFGSPSDNDSGRIQYNQASDQMVLRTNSTIALTIDSSQNATFTGNAEFADNGRAIFGTGSDLQIYHDGTRSYISDSGTGDLRLQASEVRMVNAANTEVGFKFVEDGAASLYFNANEKLATTGSGINVTGAVVSDGLTVEGDGSFTGGFQISGSSPKIFLNETDTTNLNTRIRNAAGNLQIQTVSDSDASPTTRFAIDHSTGDINFYEDTGTNAKLTWDSSAESLNFADNGKAIFGAGSDLQIYHDGTHSVIEDAGTGNLILQSNGTQVSLQSTTELYLTAANNGAVTAYHNGSAKLSTTSTGIDVTGTVTASGTIIAVSGSNQAELTNLGSLELTRAGSNAFIDFKTTTSEDFDCRIQQDSDGLIFVTGGSSTATALTLNSSQNATFAGTAVADNFHINSTSGHLKISRVGSSSNGIYWDRNGTQDAAIQVASNEQLNIDNNFGTPINFRIGADGSENTYLSVSSSGIDVTGTISIATGSLEMGTTAIIDQSRNLSVATANIGGATSSHVLNVFHPTTNVVARFESGDTDVWIDLHDSNSGTYGALLGHSSSVLFRVADQDVNDRMTLNNSGLLNTDAGYSVGGTTVINSSRNLTNIGTISSGAITSTGQVQGSRLKIDVPDNGGAPALTAYMDIYGFEGRGAGINIRDQANSASGSSNREWFIGSGYAQSGFNIGYSATGSQTSYSAQNKFSLDTSGNAVIAGTITASGSLTTQAGSATAGIKIKRTNSSTTGAKGYIGFQDSNGNYVANIHSRGTGSNNSGDLRFYTSTGESYSDVYADPVAALVLNSDNKATFAAPITVNTSTSEQIVLSGANNPYIRFQEGTTDKAYVQWHSGGYIRIANQENGLIAFWPTVNRASELVLIRNDATVVVGEDFGSINFASLDGTGDFPTQTVAQMPARIVAEASETQGTNDEGSRLRFYTKPNDTNKAADSVEQLRIEHNGDVTVYNGDLKLNNNNITGVTDLTIADQIFHAGDTDTYIQFHAANQFRVVTGGNERFEVNQSTATVAGNLNVRAAIDLADNDILRLGSGDDAEFFVNGSHLYLDLNAGIGNFYIRDGNTTRYTFNDNGSFTATGNVTAYSDRRVKAQFEPITDALTKVQQLHGQTYIRTDMDDANRRYAGLIAQDVEVVLPEAVSEVDDHLTLDYSGTIALLVEAIKDLKDEVDELKEKLEAA